MLKNSPIISASPDVMGGTLVLLVLGFLCFYLNPRLVKETSRLLVLSGRIC